MLKTNVIKQDYRFLIRNSETSEEKEIVIHAESEESAKLRIPEGWVVVKNTLANQE